MAQGKTIPTFITVGDKTIKSSLIAVVGKWIDSTSVFDILLENGDKISVVCSKGEYTEFMEKIKLWVFFC